MHHSCKIQFHMSNHYMNNPEDKILGFSGRRMCRFELLIYCMSLIDYSIWPVWNWRVEAFISIKHLFLVYCTWLLLNTRGTRLCNEASIRLLGNEVGRVVSAKNDILCNLAPGSWRTEQKYWTHISLNLNFELSRSVYNRCSFEFCLRYNPRNIAVATSLINFYKIFRMNVWGTSVWLSKDARSYVISLRCKPSFAVSLLVRLVFL